ncbi:unnamed protein product [Amoebophrya sp. A120]|nr:unnamed protein product [Amoebophrya sp. A120]|eukprot:GSA120T00018374001.1
MWPRACLLCRRWRPGSVPDSWVGRFQPDSARGALLSSVISALARDYVARLHLQLQPVWPPMVGWAPDRSSALMCSHPFLRRAEGMGVTELNECCTRLRFHRRLVGGIRSPAARPIDRLLKFDCVLV